MVTTAALFSAGLYPQLKTHLVLGKTHGITQQEAVEVPGEDSRTEWCEAVDDGQYSKLN